MTDRRAVQLYEHPTYAAIMAGSLDWAGDGC
jgi:hypothetical protein